MKRAVKPAFVAYVGFRKQGAKGSPFSFSSTLSDVERWARGEKPARDPGNDNDSDDNPEPQPDLHLKLDALAKRFADSMAGFHPLIGISGALGPVFERSMVNNQLRSMAEEKYTLLKKIDDVDIFGVIEDRAIGFLNSIREITEMQQGMSVLPGSTLLSLVAVYDSYTVELIRILLRGRPDRYAHADKLISVKDVLSMNSFDEVIDSIIESEVDGLMRSSHQEQIQYIENNFNIKIRESYQKWARFVEIFERRNLVAHGNTIVNNAYFKNCNSVGFKVDAEKLGTTLNLSDKYLKTSLDALTEFGLLLIFSLWRKALPDKVEEIYERMHQITYAMIEKGHYEIASRILDYLLDLKVNISDRKHRMMTVNRANSYKKMGRPDQCKNILSKSDWGAVADDFSICIAALNDDIEKFVNLMPLVQSKESVGKSGFVDWPVFDTVRNDERVKAKYLELFGEPLVSSNRRDRNRASPATREVTA